MSFLKNIFGKKKKKDVFSETPEGVCPNCWGDQEYDNVVRVKFKDSQIAVNNNDPTAQYAFIQDFVVTHLDGIKLKSSRHGLECPTCRIVIKKNP